jgi:RNA polymerase sigma-70 factor (ECF subfamily)
MTSRDDQGFTATVTPLLKDLYGAALRLTRNPAEAEDLVQDSMLRAFRFWDTFKQGTNIRAWMFTILRNTFINSYHKRSRMRALELDINDQMRALGASVALAHADGTSPSPEEMVSASITAVRIREALDQLPVDFRQAVMLADLEGLPYAEIAEIMQSPIGTVMSRVYRGRKQLHTLLFDVAPEGQSNVRAS